jgi:hypothetical protein
MYLGYHQIILFKISYWISVKFKKKRKKRNPVIELDASPEDGSMRKNGAKDKHF